MGQKTRIREFRELPSGPPSEPPLAHSIDAAATRSGLGRSKIFELIRTGRLKAVKCDRRTLITEAALQEFLSSLPPYRAHRSEL